MRYLAALLILLLFTSSLQSNPPTAIPVSVPAIVVADVAQTFPGFWCIARTVFGEARNQSPEGQALVVHSILNRMARTGLPACTIAKRWYHGYAVWAPPREPWRRDPMGWRMARDVTSRVIRGQMNIGDCSHVTHFLNPNMLERLPGWASRKNELCRIGDHVAYLVFE